MDKLILFSTNQTVRMRHQSVMRNQLNFLILWLCVHLSYNVKQSLAACQKKLLCKNCLLIKIIFVLIINKYWTKTKRMLLILIVCKSWNQHCQLLRKISTKRKLNLKTIIKCISYCPKLCKFKSFCTTLIYLVVPNFFDSVYLQNFFF